MRIDPNFITGLTGSLNAISATEQRLTQQLSSGSRVNQLSDDSVAVSSAARMQSELSLNDTFINTATGLTGRMQTADSALSTVVQQLTQAISLSTQANNGTLNADAKATVAQQLQNIKSTVLSMANSSFQGQYLFAGSATDSPAFASNGTYSGDSSIQYVTTPTGQKIATNVPGSNIFSQALSALDDAIAGATSGDTTATGKLGTALNTVTAQRAAFENSLSAVQSASDTASQRKSEITIAQTELLSADPAQVATDLSNTQTQQKALLSVIASLGKSNLFDFLS
ncbi:flagellin N-terminal helical domain-containing protein [Terriglobus albidus]|uniref:flagellin N-terminal helical domain-containing protein n=1 Tax=Terriglobus albidus TaxID=1592106 RepID=UPI0021E03E53|nr:flagellar hook-associated protein 3 [Terriglobus albidus]